MKSKALSLIICIMLLAGCAGMNVKTPDQMTAKERGTFTLTLYNNAYSNYNAQFAATPKPMSKEMTDYFRGYKQVMESAWPVISAYTAIVKVNGAPTMEQEQQIINIIYQLQAVLLAKTS
jgi:hypothetical protein